MEFWMPFQEDAQRWRFPQPHFGLAGEDAQRYKRLSGFSSGDYVIQLKNQVFFFPVFNQHTHIILRIRKVSTFLRTQQ